MIAGDSDLLIGIPYVFTNNFINFVVNFTTTKC